MAEASSSSSAKLDVESAGARLREEIDQAYRSLDRDKKIKTVGHGANSIAPLVSKYLPRGTPFAQAEEILRSAGFTIGPKQKSYFNSDLQVIAKIDPYETSAFGKSGITVILRPTSQADWAQVGEVEAEIVRVYL